MHLYQARFGNKHHCWQIKPQRLSILFTKVVLVAQYSDLLPTELHLFQKIYKCWAYPSTEEHLFCRGFPAEAHNYVVPFQSS